MTGYATVTRNMVVELKKHFGDKLHLDICAINYNGEGYTEYDGTVQVVSALLSQREVEGVAGDEFGRMFFLDKIRSIEYDGIFILQDLGTIAGLVPLLREIQDNKKSAGLKVFKSMIYFPVDGPIQGRVKNKLFIKEKFDALPKERKQYFKEYISQLDELDFFDTVVTYTNFGKSEILKHRPSLKDKIKVLYHGTNTTDFFPIDENEKTKFRKQYFGKNADKFIVGLINRNQYRKDIGTSIFGFIEAKYRWNQDLPRPFLYLHMKADDPHGMNLNNVLSHTDLVEGKDYMFAAGDEHGQVDVQTLNKIYNSIDVYLSTALGGGFELSVSESMSCKKPCIVPNHTSLGELGADGRAYLLEEFLPIANAADNTVRQMCHYEEVGEAITKVARNLLNPKNTTESDRVEKAYKWITSLTWDVICIDWTKYFEETYKIK